MGRFLVIFIILSATIGGYIIIQPRLEFQSLYTSPQNEGLIWSFDNNTSKWEISGIPPACPEPLTIDSPVDVTTANAVLYPGQYRGEDYKAHGGFHFNTTDNSVEVEAIMDMYLFKASRYIQGGEVQYSLFFINNCGLMVMHDHILTLSPQLEKILEILPPAKKDDSRTTNINPPAFIKKGEVIATEVGFKTYEHIVTVDFGLYDLRMQNTISQDPAWRASHPHEKEFGYHGLCWMDLLVEDEKRLAKSLPTGIEGKMSDYCK
jgi:hypothetical protein